MENCIIKKSYEARHRPWNALLNPKRFRETTAPTTLTHWNPFDSDYSRISLSAPFRRLQGKAQVFPFDDNDFVRTRLTHSIEVSGIARSMGVLLENYLLDVKEIREDKLGHIPSILSVAGLAHDIGNPPFGHFGEKAIQDFFSDADQQKIIRQLDEIEQSDLCNFEGNAQGLRLLLRLGLAKERGSFNLTLPALASIIKYPYNSLDGNKSRDQRIASNLGISYKKFGFFQTEHDHNLLINDTLGLNNKRHPLCFILEAADDICYSVSDIEDGIKKKTITIEYIIEKLKRHKDDEHCRNMLLMINELYDNKTRLNALIIAQECRIFAQRHMIHDSFEAFRKHYENIMSGIFDSELLETSKSKVLRNFFEEISEKNFGDKTVVKRELVGHRVIKFLAKEFVYAALAKGKGRNTKEGKLYSLIPEGFIKVRNDTIYKSKPYVDILLATDFICSMTDSYALSLYNELRGV